MPDSARTDWKERVVKIWAPVATVVSALKVLLFDLPQIYHKVAQGVSLAVVGKVLEYGGILILLLIAGSVPYDQSRFTQRVLGVVSVIGYLWFYRHKPDQWVGVAMLGWGILIYIAVSLWKERARDKAN